MRVLGGHPSRAVAAVAVAAALGACGTGAATSTPATVLRTATPAPPSATLAVAPTLALTPAPSLSALKLLWQKAGPLSGKTETYWPAIDPLTGDVWVASSFQDEYWIFRPDGTFAGAWGAGGQGQGQLDLTTHDVNPDGAGAIAFAPDGSFYVADVGNNRVEKFDSQRRFVLAWGSFGTGNGQFTAAKGIATDGRTVYVADDSNLMQAFDTNGRFLRSFTFPFVLFSLTGAGNLVVADDTGLHAFDGTGAQVASYPIDQAGLDGGPSQVVVDSKGDAFVGFQTDGGPTGMVELGPTGALIAAWSTGGETMALAPDDASIYLADTGPSLSGWPFVRKYALPKP